MNRSDVAFAIFVACVAFNPTFRPVILDVMPQSNRCSIHMAKRKHKSVRLPRLNFRNALPKLTNKQMAQIGYILDLPNEYQRFLQWRNGGIPDHRYFNWDHPQQGSIQSRVERFFGIALGSFDIARPSDTIWAILRFRHWLPRWSIPIAFVDEDSFLITFTEGARLDQVWLKYWCHDAPDDDTDPESDCFLIAHSVPELVTHLHDAAVEEE